MTPPTSANARIATNSGIHVFPICATSGVDSPTYAVSNFSCAAVHGICWTTTRMVGFCLSNSGMRAATCSPSEPNDQKVRTSRGTAARPRAARASLGQPSSRESSACQPAPHMFIALHDAPHELAAMVLNHRHDWSLIDAEVVHV